MLDFTVCPDCTHKKLYDVERERVANEDAIQIQVTIGDHGCTTFLDNLQMSRFNGPQSQYLGEITARIIHKIQSHIENLKQEG